MDIKLTAKQSGTNCKDKEIYITKIIWTATLENYQNTPQTVNTSQKILLGAVVFLGFDCCAVVPIVSLNCL